jgi:hypothetical protein
MDESMTKEKLLDLIQTEHTNLEEELGALNEQQITLPGVLGEWSVKDILSHITYWEQRMLNRFATGQGLHPPPGMTVDKFIDYLNHQNYVAHRERPLADVLADFQKSYLQVLEHVARLSDDDLTNPNRYAWWPGEPVWHYIRGDTYGHYREHTEPIRAWRESRVAGSCGRLRPPQ